MHILSEFSVYFLILMIIVGLTAVILDSKQFKRANMIRSSKVIRVLGIVIILVSFILYIARIFYT